jgi:hypothetical protein
MTFKLYKIKKNQNIFVIFYFVHFFNKFVVKIVKIIVVNYQTSPPNVNFLRLFAKQNIKIAISMKNKDVPEYLRKKLHALGSPSRVPIKGFSDHSNLGMIMGRVGPDLYRIGSSVRLSKFSARST